MWLGHTWDAALVLGGEEVKDAFEGHLMSCLPGMHMMSLVSNRDAKMDLKIRRRVLSNLLLVGDAKFDDYDN